jgi:flavin-dependent dehydrogenase
LPALVSFAIFPALSPSNTMAQIIVVGGGLAGLSAAHTILERGGNVLLLDKQGFVQYAPCLRAPADHRTRA